jgi:hypothetical protein
MDTFGSIGLVRTDPRPLKTTCGWHKQYFPTEPEFVITEGELRNGMCSTGICDRCNVLYREEWKQYMKGG